MAFGNMLTFYGPQGHFGLMANSRQNSQDFLFDYLNVVESTLYKGFFLDREIFLPIEGMGNIEEEYNTLRFPIGILIGLREVKGVSSESLSDLSSIVARSFQTFSSLYYNQNYQVQSILDKYNRDHEEYIKYIIEKKVRPKLGVFSYMRGKKSESIAYLIEQITYELRKDFKSYDELRGFRKEIDIFSKNRDSHITFQFATRNFDSRSISIELIKNDLIEMGYVSWGCIFTAKSNPYKIVKEYKRSIGETAVNRIYSQLDFIIRDENLGKGRVVLLPLLHYETGYVAIEKLSDTGSFKYMPKKGYIELDTSDPNYRLFLRHFIYLMLAGRCSIMLKECRLDTKDFNSVLSDKSMIFACSRDRVLNPSDIFTYNLVNSDHHISLHPVKVETLTFPWFTVKNHDWFLLWGDCLAWTSGPSSELTSYVQSTIQGRGFMNTLF